MLTSSNQYLRPEYLTPLPTTLDAKKSPLALLAQTCSQIGADAPNAKLIQSSEKSNKNLKSDSNKEKSSHNSAEPSHHKSNFKTYDSCLTREKSRSPEERSSSVSTGSRVRTPLTSKGSISGGGNVRCASNQSATSPRTSPSGSERKTPAGDGNERTGRTSSSPSKSSERNSPHTPSSSATKTAFTPNILTSSSDPAIKDLPLGTFKPGASMSPSYLGYPPGFPMHMDFMTSSLMSQHHALKSGGLSPYLSYGRMKVADTMQTVCRDPYCSGCGVNSHLLGASSAKTQVSCPAGCAQCDHAKVPTSSAYLTHNPAAAAYAHAQLAALAAASHLPYVCNWISGDAAYCGKRFSSSEELLSHLRSHTSVASVSEASTALSMLSSSGLPPSHPLFHRTYPTPPLSPLATTRFHPYSKPSLLPPSLSSSPLSNFSLSHPGLPPYLSPYSIYGPRLGATPSMHP